MAWISVSLVFSLIHLFVAFSVMSFADPGHLNEPVVPSESDMRLLVKRRFEKNDSAQRGVLISTSYRCRSACRCEGMARARSSTEYVVCADSQEEATDMVVATGACKSICPLGSAPRPASPACQPTNVQCKKAHCP
ncbi:MAG: hypothetical protein EB120_08130 [Proteobacteria bacterium]|nr:hypothetical protein [Pseudomonadota bacterium]NDG27127.1 hypothetical protein [Pseudomonadota bacterium]